MKKRNKSQGPEEYGWEDGVQIGAVMSGGKGGAVKTLDDLATELEASSFAKYFDLSGAERVEAGVFVVRMRRAEWVQAQKAGGMTFKDPRTKLEIEVPFP